jgi:hypothetical protein
MVGYGQDAVSQVHDARRKSVGFITEEDDPGQEEGRVEKIVPVLSGPVNHEVFFFPQAADI